jgi:hypothetical protein
MGGLGHDLGFVFFPVNQFESSAKAADAKHRIEEVRIFILPLLRKTARLIAP